MDKVVELDEIYQNPVSKFFYHVPEGRGDPPNIGFLENGWDGILDLFSDFI